MEQLEPLTPSSSSWMLSTDNLAGCWPVTKYARGPNELVSDQYKAFSKGRPRTSKLEKRQKQKSGAEMLKVA